MAEELGQANEFIYSRNDEVSNSISKKLESNSNPFAQRIGKALSWSNVNMNLAVKGKDDRKLLDGVWGKVPNKEVTVIMGPSGSGKTSLLNILAGRSRTRGKITIGANVKLDGVPINPLDISVRKQIAFVPQEESLQITATPREAIKFSAKLRLPKSFSDKNIEELVETMIKELGLEDCADTFIGGGLIKGISGGQKKRTSVGVELVVKPSMIFLDEPTSGLDSYSAVQVVKILKKVANAGASVLFTIHQPPSEVFHTFDHLILLNKGRVMYEGAVNEISSFLISCGKPMPDQFNPADWMMQIAQSYPVEDLEKDGFFPRCSEISKGYDEVISKTKDESHFQRVSTLTELLMLAKRELQGLIRDKKAISLRFGITLIMNVLFGLIFWKVGASDLSNPQHLQSQFGALVLILINSIFGSAQGSLSAFPAERPVFVREYSTNHYSVLPYFLSKLMVEIILVALQSFITVIISYYMVAFKMSFIKLFLLIFTLSLLSNATAVAIGSTVEDAHMAREFFPLLVIPQMLFAGFFVSMDLIPKWLRWCEYVCFLTYSLKISLHAEFGNCGDAATSCDQLLESNGVDPNKIWLYWTISGALFLFFRLFGLAFIRSKAHKFY